MASKFDLTEVGPISKSFTKAKLIELCVDKTGVQTGPFGSQLHKEDYVALGTPIITVEHLGDNVIEADADTPKVSDEDKERLKKFQLKDGDIVFSRVGSVDRRAYVSSHEEGWLFSGRCLRVRVDKNKIYPKYLSYYFGYEGFKKYIRGIAVGATMPSINTKILSEIDVYFPSYDEQIKIADYLTFIEEKIQLNRKTNQTLEQMAQALFKSWFVDFDPVIDNALAAGTKVSDFPEALQHKALIRQEIRAIYKDKAQQLAESPETKSNPDGLPQEIRALFPSEFEQTDEPSIGIAGWIPKGWKKASFESLIKLIGGGTPKTSVEEYWNGDIPWFSVVDAPNDSDVFVLDTEKHVTQLGADKSSTKILRKGTTIISARGTVGKCALVAEPLAMNQSCYGLNGIEDVSDEFIYFMTRYQVSDLQKRGHGSVFNTITRETFKSIILPFSGGEITQKFADVVSPFLNKILLNNKQNVELEKTRNVLLPKLISGEISIPEFKESMEA